MILNLTAEGDLRLLHAKVYLLREHGENAVAEAEAALQYAKQIGDQSTVDVFLDIISSLSKRTFEMNALVENGSGLVDETRSVATGAGLPDPSTGG